jgi:hypothetical protein
MRPERMLFKLDQEHVDFLTSAKTLEKWAGETLRKRTFMFH